MTMYRPRVYTASKPHYVKLWRMLQEDPEWSFVEFTASWVNHPDIDAEVAGEQPGPDVFREAWVADIHEVRVSDFVLLYGKDSDSIRGSLVECGVALGQGNGVIVVGFNPEVHTWMYHPAVKRFNSLVEARQHLYRFVTMAPPTRRGRKAQSDVSE